MTINQATLKDIRNSLVKLESNGVVLGAQVHEALDSLETPHYRIAILGQYQVGKSTLINRIFLGGDELLKEGKGACTTAVATDLEYASSSKLAVYHWDENNPGKEKLVYTTDNPCAEDVENATVASKTESREDLAKKISRVCITVPNGSLKNYTIIDTPGLDDPNQELLLNTTWRIIPNVDMALLVVECRPLTDVELELLRKQILERNGIKRIMVLISYKPFQDLDAEQRNNIFDSIKAQLANIGQGDTPVEMYCYDASITDIMSDISDIRLTIRNFLQENALKARTEKVEWLLRGELEKHLLDISVKLKATSTTTEEQVILAQKIRNEIDSFKESAQLEFERLIDDVKCFKVDIDNTIDRTVATTFNLFLTDIKRNKDNIPAMQALLDSAPIRLKSDLLDKLAIISIQANDNFNRVIEKYMENTRSARGKIEILLQEEFNYKRPLLSKLPKFAISIINFTALYYIVYAISPIAAIVGIGLQIFGHNPTQWIITEVTIAKTQKCLDEMKVEVAGEIKKQFAESIKKSFEEVKSAIEAYNKEHVGMLNEKLAQASRANADVEALEGMKIELEKILATL